MSPLHISNSTQNNTNCRKLVIIHITKRHSFIVLYSLHSLYQSVYAYMNMRITMVMLLRHSGHVSITATRFAQLSQKRACPQGTSANPSRGATKYTSQQVSAAASAAVCGAVDVVVGVGLDLSVWRLWAGSEALPTLKCYNLHALTIVIIVTKLNSLKHLVRTTVAELHK